MYNTQRTLRDPAGSAHGSAGGISDLSPRVAWQLDAACRGSDGAWFFASDREPASHRVARTALAKAVCSGCPVVAECRTYALANKEPFGIWGGLTEEERAAALRARRRLQLRLTQATQLALPEAATVAR